MKVRTIPSTRDGLISLATEALAGATSIGVAINLKQNDAAKISADLFDLTGLPGSGPTAGKQGLFALQRSAENVSQVDRRQSVAEGRAFCGRAVDLLKSHLGRSWNANWEAAGFGGGSLALPRDPLPKLLELRSYLRAHPEHESTNPDVTADRADSLANDIQQANDRVNTARTSRTTARKNRDAAIKKLRLTMSGLRTELKQLLAPDDERWFRFGFNRLTDGRIPESVVGLRLLAGAPHEVVAEWDRSARAESYRVTRQIRNVDPVPVEVGLIGDTIKVIRGLPSGATVEIRVSARNSKGESIPTLAVIVMP